MTNGQSVTTGLPILACPCTCSQITNLQRSSGAVEIVMIEQPHFVDAVKELMIGLGNCHVSLLIIISK